jgi:hypothetical protein
VLACRAKARRASRSVLSFTPYSVSRSATSRSLNPTRPSSIRLILDSDARISHPAASRVTPLASRSLRSCEPSRIRSTVGPPAPGSGPVVTLPSRDSSTAGGKHAMTV